MSSIKKSKLNINELISEEEKLTFLVGAGASVGAPSQLPAASETIEALIKFSCTKSEIDKILQIEDLRFEILAGIILESLDDVKFLDFYQESDKPNLEHLILAEMIKKGHFIITTNFDFLLEYALLQSDIPKKKIVPVITEKDFERFSDPEKLYRSGKFPIYKIHGSPKNIITGEDTRKSFINTLKLIGLNQTKNNIIQLEPYKAQFLEKMSSERTLIVMGYSGKNDYDLIPTLKVMDDLKNLIWINHISKSITKDELYEVGKPKASELSGMDSLDQRLSEIKRLNEAVNVYRLNINTPKFLEYLLKNKEELSEEKFSIDLMKWLKSNVKEPSEIIKLYISNKIYFETKNYTDSLRCLERIFRLGEDSGDNRWIAISLMEMGIINYAQTNYKDAIEWLRKSLQVQLKIKVFPQRVSIFKFLGLSYQAQQNYVEAIRNFEHALKENEKIKDFNEKSDILKNLGISYQHQEDYETALKYLESAIKINERYENLAQKANNYKLKGKIYYSQKQYEAALSNFKQALEINEKLENFKDKAEILNFIGRISHDIGDSLTGLEKCNQALRIYDLMQYTEGVLESLNSIGEIYRDQWNYPKAFEYFEEGFQTAEKLGDTLLQAKFSSQLGLIFQKQDKHFEALKWFEDSLKFFEEAGEERGKVDVLRNMGL
ncbi:MAG: tetratricopeptide repeat protein, partial [Promethearchaeota archaeon]